MKGLSFPFAAGPQFPSVAVDGDAVESALEALLHTPRGSRVMRPELGVDLDSLVFDQLHAIQRAVVSDQIRRQASDYCGAIVDDVVFSPGRTPQEWTIEVQWRSGGKTGVVVRKMG